MSMLWGPTKLELELQGNVSDLEREIGTLRVEAKDLERERDEALQALEPLQNEVADFQGSIVALEEANDARVEELEAELAEALRGQTSDSEEVDESEPAEPKTPATAFHSGTELENERAQAILRDQAVRELENDNTQFAEREAELQSELQKYRDREKEHFEILTRVFQKISGVVAEEAGKFQVSGEQDLPDLIGQLESIDYEQEFEPDEPADVIG
jgi:uncharacterized coiled-coil DUF342 family protein